MKHPGDILYLLKFVGADVLAVTAAVLIIVAVSLVYFSARGRKRRCDRPQDRVSRP